jgi:hypothetical protein
MRQVECWKGSGRVVVADSAFSSVATATALLNLGLYFIGVVKTATRLLPLKLMEEFTKEGGHMGPHTTITTTVETKDGSQEIMAVLYRLKREEVRTVIGTCSNALEGTPHKVARTRKVIDQGTLCIEADVLLEKLPALPSFRKTGQSTSDVDFNGRPRQGELNLEVSWGVQRCWLRVFTTVLGVIFTDCYLAWRLENGRLPTTNTANEDDYKAHFHGFVAALAADLIWNTVDGVPPTPVSTRSENTVPVVAVPNLSVIVSASLFDTCMRKRAWSHRKEKNK